MVRKTAKHVPRNQKKYWRKISTKDIEDQLDDVRVQEMTGYVIFNLNRHYNNEKKPLIVKNGFMDTIGAYLRLIRTDLLKVSLHDFSISSHAPRLEYDGFKKKWSRNRTGTDFSKFLGTETEPEPLFLFF